MLKLGQMRPEWSKSFNEHEVARTELNGFVSIEEAPEDLDLYERTAREISELLEATPNLETAILVRKNRELLPYILACEAEGLTVSAEGGNPLTDSPVVVYILHLLHAVSQPSDTRTCSPSGIKGYDLHIPPIRTAH